MGLYHKDTMQINLITNAPSAPLNSWSRFFPTLDLVLTKNKLEKREWEQGIFFKDLRDFGDQYFLLRTKGSRGITGW